MLGHRVTRTSLECRQSLSYRCPGQQPGPSPTLRSEPAQSRGSNVSGQESQGSSELTAIASGDREAIRAFYARTSANAFGLALRITGDSAAAELACEDAYAALGATASGIEDALRLEARFLASVREFALARRPADARVNADSSDPAERSYTIVNAVRDSLATLDPLAQQALDLAYFGGLNVQQIAEVTGKPASELRPILRDALLRLGAATRQQEERSR